MVFMKVNLEILKKMDKGNIILIIKILTKANGKMIKRKEKNYMYNGDWLNDMKSG